ncbi:hypothetical protein DV737_g1305, partial [Chaetothyriales sp. CBS 132003]
MSPVAPSRQALRFLNRLCVKPPSCRPPPLAATTAAGGNHTPTSPAAETATLPDTSTFYTLFPSTLPHGPPPHRCSSFAIDLPKLRREFLALQSRFHPDKYDASSSTYRRALTLSSLINNAYRTLSDPLLRAQYLLQLLYDIDVTSEDNSQFQVDQGTLTEVMDAQEAVEEAQSVDEVNRLKEENRQRMDEAISRIGGSRCIGVTNMLDDRSEPYDENGIRIPLALVETAPANERVSAGVFGHVFVRIKELGRKSLVRWVLNEIDVGEWINKDPAVGNY